MDYTNYGEAGSRKNRKMDNEEKNMKRQDQREAVRPLQIVSSL
jgi:hypothetical protein